MLIFLFKIHYACSKTKMNVVKISLQSITSAYNCKDTKCLANKITLYFASLTELFTTNQFTWGEFRWILR